jgi:hypothetical protein
MQGQRFVGLGIIAAAVFAGRLTHAQGAAPAPVSGSGTSSAPAAAGSSASAAPAAGPASAAPGAVAAPPGQPQPAAGAPAQPAPATAAAPIYVEQPPLPPLEPRNRHYHDGFYLRISAGFGGAWTSSKVTSGDFSSTDRPKSEVSGSGASFDFMMGGTPAPGLVVGGGILFQETFSPSVPQPEGTSVPGFDPGTLSSLPFLMIGPMVDAFPNPSYGFHFGGLLGLAQMGLKDNQGNSSGGVGIAAWLGYMWWTSSQWSIGGLVRGSAAWTGRTVGPEGNQFDVADNSRTVNVMFSAAYH